MNEQGVKATKPANWTPQFESRMLCEVENHEAQIADWGVLLWSQSQNGFHVERVQDMLSSNRLAYTDDRRMDYVPVFIGSRDACLTLAQRLRGTIRMRAASSRR